MVGALVLSLLLMLNLETTGPGLVLTAVTAGAVLMPKPVRPAALKAFLTSRARTD